MEAAETNPARRVLFVFRDSPDMRERLKQRAVREQTTVSDILRRALAAYLNDNDLRPATDRRMLPRIYP